MSGEAQMLLWASAVTLLSGAGLLLWAALRDERVATQRARRFEELALVAEEEVEARPRLARFARDLLDRQVGVRRAARKQPLGRLDHEAAVVLPPAALRLRERASGQRRPRRRMLSVPTQGASSKSSMPPRTPLDTATRKISRRVL